MEFSVVEFATQAFITSGLTDDVAAKAAVNGIAYSGGFTNTEQAILKCNATLNTSTADMKYIALFTDGAPTVFGFTDTGPSSGCNVNGGPVGSDCRNAAVPTLTPYPCTLSTLPSSFHVIGAGAK